MPVAIAEFESHFVGLSRQRVAKDFHIGPQVVTVRGDLGELRFQGDGSHGFVGQAVPLRAQLDDAFLEMGEIGLAFLENLFELRMLVRLTRKLPLKIRRQLCRLDKIVFQGRIVRRQAPPAQIFGLTMRFDRSAIGRGATLAMLPAAAQTFASLRS